MSGSSPRVCSAGPEPESSLPRPISRLFGARPMRESDATIPASTPLER